jgi:putative DNA primase/helicase
VKLVKWCDKCELQLEDCVCNEDSASESHEEPIEEGARHRGLEDSVPNNRILPAPTKPMAVARQLVDEMYTHNDKLHLRTYRGDSYGWDGTCWPEIESRSVRGSVYRYTEDAVFLKDGIEQVPWDPTRYKIDNVLDALRAVTHLDGTVEASAWINGAADLPPDEIVSMDNGLLHIPTRTLLRHSPDFWSHHSLPFDFDPDAPAPVRWLGFLEELFGDDKSAITTLQETFGYILGGDTRQQKIFLLVGPRRGGKGTIGRVLTGLLGKHNVAAPTLAGMATNFGLSPLIGKPLGLISDARLSGKADAHVVVERLLSVSGEDSITVDRKYKDQWTGRLPTRFLVLTNELPRLSDSSGALASRFIVFVLTNSFLGREDPALTDKLLEEASGIFRWALEGHDRLTQRGYFEQPASSAEAIQQLEDLSSPVSAFIRDQCDVGTNQRVSVDVLWSAWKDWCDEQNRHPGTKAVFGRDLKAAAPTIRKARSREDGSRSHEYLGIGIVGTTMGRSHDHYDHGGQEGGSGHGGHGGHSNSPLLSQHPGEAAQPPLSEDGGA